MATVLAWIAAVSQWPRGRRILFSKDYIWKGTALLLLLVTIGMASVLGRNVAMAQATTKAYAHTVTVTGFAREYFPVSATRLTISLDGQQSSPTQIAQQLEDTAKGIDGAWRQTQIASNAIRVHKLTIWSQQHHVYNASMQLTVTLATTQAALKALATADHATVHSLQGITFEDQIQQVAIPTSSIRSHLLQSALLDAKQQALTLAKQADEKLGAITKLKTVPYPTSSQQGLSASPTWIGGVQVVPTAGEAAEALVSAVSVTYQLTPSTTAR